eukprot:PhF_6_TR1078/c2_g2_i1/m.2310
MCSTLCVCCDGQRRDSYAHTPTLSRHSLTVGKSRSITPSLSKTIRSETVYFDTWTPTFSNSRTIGKQTHTESYTHSHSTSNEPTMSKTPSFSSTISNDPSSSMTLSDTHDPTMDPTVSFSPRTGVKSSTVSPTNEFTSSSSLTAEAKPVSFSKSWTHPRTMSFSVSDTISKNTKTPTFSDTNHTVPTQGKSVTETNSPTIFQNSTTLSGSVEESIQGRSKSQTQTPTLTLSTSMTDTPCWRRIAHLEPDTIAMEVIAGSEGDKSRELNITLECNEWINTTLDFPKKFKDLLTVNVDIDSTHFFILRAHTKFGLEGRLDAIFPDDPKAYRFIPGGTLLIQMKDDAAFDLIVPEIWILNISSELLVQKVRLNQLQLTISSPPSQDSEDVLVMSWALLQIGVLGTAALGFFAPPFDPIIPQLILATSESDCTPAAEYTLYWDSVVLLSPFRDRKRTLIATVLGNVGIIAGAYALHRFAVSIVMITTDAYKRFENASSLLLFPHIILHIFSQTFMGTVLYAAILVFRYPEGILGAVVGGIVLLVYVGILVGIQSWHRSHFIFVWRPYTPKYGIRSMYAWAFHRGAWGPSSAYEMLGYFIGNSNFTTSAVKTLTLPYGFAIGFAVIIAATPLSWCTSMYGFLSFCFFALSVYVGFVKPYRNDFASGLTATLCGTFGGVMLVDFVIWVVDRKDRLAVGAHSACVLMSAFFLCLRTMYMATVTAAELMKYRQKIWPSYDPTDPHPANTNQGDDAHVDFETGIVKAITEPLMRHDDSSEEEMGDKSSAQSFSAQRRVRPHNMMQGKNLKNFLAHVQAIAGSVSMEDEIPRAKKNHKYFLIDDVEEVVKEPVRQEMQHPINDEIENLHDYVFRKVEIHPPVSNATLQKYNPHATWGLDEVDDRGGGRKVQRPRRTSVGGVRGRGPQYVMTTRDNVPTAVRVQNSSSEDDGDL